ncbi:MAG: hypothetical protein I8H78_05145, partial [Flavobacteriales bacterium]|nr:hypothetical protein [Flavobacteriales bacterium]
MIKIDFLRRAGALIFLLFLPFLAFGAVTITPANATVNTCQLPTDYFSLGDIIIAEGAATDFSIPASNTNYTLILNAPANFQFNAGAGNVAVLPSGDITAASITVTATAITITYRSGQGNRANAFDRLTISNLQIRGLNATATGNITRPATGGGSGAIAGITSASNFGSLSSANTPTSVTGNPLNTTVNAGANAAFTVSANNGPTAYLWQVSADAGATWSTVTNGGVYSNATTATLNITGVNIGMNGYRYRAAASNACGTSAYSASALLTVNLVYCTPTGSLNCSLQDYIANVTLSTLNNTTLCNGGGYTNFPKTGSQTTTVVKSFTYPFSLTVGSGSGNHGAGVWIDFNQNGIFSDAGEFFLVSNAISPNSSTSVNILIPAGAATGDVRMRVRYGYNINVNSGMSCAMGGTWGETEDYTITITNPAACNVPVAQPTSLVLTPNETAINGSFTAASPAPNSYLVVANTTGTAPAPMNGTAYAIGSTALGGSNIVIDTDADTTFSAVGLTPLTTYYFFVYSMNNYCTGGPLYLTDSPLTGSGTTTYCSPVIQNPNGVYINSVSFIGTLSDPPVNNSGAGSNGAGYSDYTGLASVAQQAQGEGVNITASVTGSDYFIATWKVWVDWDEDGNFSDASEVVYNPAGYYSATANFGFEIPPTQTPGNYRMRIRVTRDTLGDACENIVNGETEDYLITVLPNCSAKISGIGTGSECFISGGKRVTLTATSSEAVTEFRWYTSPTGGSYTSSPPVGGTSTTFLTPLLTASTLYYVTAFNGTCESTFRIPVRAEIKLTPEITFTPSALEICGDTGVVAVSATGGNQIKHLIPMQSFEDGTLGVFTNQNNTANTPAINGKVNWQNRTSVYVPALPDYLTWYPAISSGFGKNKFVMATSDVNAGQIIDKALLSPATLDSRGLLNLTLKFKMFFSRYQGNGNNAGTEYVSVEVSTVNSSNNLNWTPIATITSDVGSPTAFQQMTYSLNTYIGEQNLRIRIRHYANGWFDGVAIDDVELYGEEPLQPSFLWNSVNPIGVYSDAGGTVPYNGGPISTVYFKPDQTQIETYDNWNVTATATLDNLCNVTGSVSIVNNSKIWNSGTNNWNNAAGWNPGNSVPTSNHCVIVKKPLLLSSGADGLAKNITINPGGSLHVNSGKTLTVTNSIINNAGDVNFVVASDANLMQVTDTAVNSGTISVLRDAYMKRQDYTYWGSPVAAQNLLAFSPKTLTTRFYVYNEADDRFTPADPATNFVPGMGYAIRSPNNFPTDNLTYQTFNGIFKGVPNNGIFSFPLKLSGNGYNLIANPYPSNIDLQLLKDLNPTRINMQAYFWTNVNVNPEMQGNNYPNGGYVSNYAVLNGTAGVPATYSVTPQNPNNGSLLVSRTPNRYIKTGQGFIVKSLVNNENLIFNNGIRTPDNTSVFFNSKVPETTDRFWLQLTTPLQVVTTAAIGYKEGAGNGFDADYDAPLMGLGSDALFTRLDEARLAIQGRQYPLDVNDVVALGTNHHAAGNYTISMPLAEGIFANGQAVYLKDLQTGAVTNLSELSYSFTAEKGLTEGRFEIVYQP